MERCTLLVADIGSTITKVAAFAFSPKPHLKITFLAQTGFPTTVNENDVSIGLNRAIAGLNDKHGLDTENAELMAAASAAGGLRMSVHGLTRDMTLKAAREASLGAGANIVLATSGLLTESDTAEIKVESPNLILLAGGVDYGDRKTVIENAKAIAFSGLHIPVIYAGNSSAAKEVKEILLNTGIPVWTVENVYPRLDELNVKPLREKIQDVFSEHIVTAPGMEKVKKMASGRIIPTPAAVLRAAELLYTPLKDTVVIDVGGATTDVHSVTEGNPSLQSIKAGPEPFSKRTVEGDLGVFYNVQRIVESSGGNLKEITSVPALPGKKSEIENVKALTLWASRTALWRHAGELKSIYGTNGKSDIIEGRDLTAVRAIIGTGGALTRLGGGKKILLSLRADPSGRKLLPGGLIGKGSALVSRRDIQRGYRKTTLRNTKTGIGPGKEPGLSVYIDTEYIMAAAGVISLKYPEEALDVLLGSINGSIKPRINSDSEEMKRRQ